MIERAKASVPLALVIGVMAFLWVEISLNFTFHWVIADDIPKVGLGIPGDFHLIAPAAFVSWGFFFAAGADMTALKKLVLACVVGSVGGLLLMFIAPELAGTPDFWGIALMVGILAALVVIASCVGDMYYVPAIFGAFAVVVFWWIATGLDRWQPDGGGVGNSLAALGKPETAGTGAFGGVLSTPAVWVFVDCLVTLLIGCLLGLISVKVTVMVTPRSAAASDAEHAHA